MRVIVLFDAVAVIRFVVMMSPSYFSVTRQSSGCPYLH